MKLVCRGYGEKGALLHNWWERKLIYSLWRIVWRSLKKLNTEPLYDPEISILGICPEKTLIWKGTCTPLFTAALFTIARTWKQPKCPMTGAWTKKMWCTHNGILLSHWKEWNRVICRDVDGPRVHYTELNKTERRRQISYINVCMWNLVKWYRWTYLQGRNRDTNVENRHVAMIGEEKRGMNWESSTDTYTLPRVK